MKNESVSKVDNSNSHPSILFVNSINSERQKALEENMLLNSENDSSDDFSIYKDETNIIDNTNFLKQNLCDGCRESDFDLTIHENEIINRGNEDAMSSKKIKLFIFYLFYLVQGETLVTNFRNGIRRGFYDMRKNNVSFMLNKFRTNIFHKFHFVGNLLGLHCTGCNHSTLSHSEVGYGKWICKDCKEDDNICEINEEEVKEMIENIFKKVHDHFYFKI